MAAAARPVYRVRNVRLPLTTISEPHLSTPPLYLRRPPWWARTPGTIGLLLCDLVMTSAFIELTWNHWTEMKIVQPPANGSEDAGSSPKQEVQWNLRPTWQRGGLCAAHFVAGCFFAGGLLGLKSQFIRSVTILPPKVAPVSSSAASNPKRPVGELRRAVIQSASHPANTGFEFPVKSSWLEEGRDKTELLLRSAEGNARWFLGLQGARISGQPFPVEEARNRLINEWKTFRPTVSKSTH